MEPSIRQAISLLASAGAGQLGLGDADDPAVVAVAAQAAIERLHAVRADAVARADATAAWQVDGAATPTAWVRGALGLGTGAAHELVRTARALHRQLPETAAAFASGEVSLGTRHHPGPARWPPRPRAPPTTAPGGEQLLLDVARVATVDELGRALRAWAHAVDESGFTADEATVYEQRQVTLAQTLDGIWYLNGLLPPAAGAALATVLDAHVASALGTGDPRTPAQLRADALTDLAHLAADADAMPGASRGRPHLLIHVPVATLLGTDGAHPPSRPQRWRPVRHHHRRTRLRLTHHPAAHRPPGTTPGRGPHHPHRAHPHPARRHRPRPHLHLPRLRPTTQLVRRPPHHPMGRRRPDRPRQLGAALPVPPHPGPPPRPADHTRPDHAWLAVHPPRRNPRGQHPPGLRIALPPPTRRRRAACA